MSSYTHDNLFKTNSLDASKFSELFASSRQVETRLAAANAVQQCRDAASGLRQNQFVTLHSIAGALGAIIALVVVYPLDTLRTRIQCNRRRHIFGTIGTGQAVLQREGFKGLYSGMRSAIWGVGVSWAVYYYCYFWLRRKILKWRGRRVNSFDNLVSGLAAGVVATLITNPIWVVNTRERLQQLEYESPWNKALQILRKDGVKGLWAGLIPALILVPSPALQFAVYESLKTSLKRLKHNCKAGSSPESQFLRGMIFPQSLNANMSPAAVKLTSWEHFLIGIISKIVPLLITYPYQVVKSRDHLKGSAHINEGVARRLFKILQSEGLGGLYKGLPSKLVASTLTAAIMSMSYEKILIWLVKAVELARRLSSPNRLLRPPSSKPYSPPIHPVQLVIAKTASPADDDEQWYRLIV